jgi:IS30 family transposase
VEVVLSSSRRVKKGPGRRPQSAKRQQFLKLLAQGWTLAAARREVGVSRSTGHNWRNGHSVRLKDGTVRCVPPLDPLTTKVISSRFLSEAERIEIADRRHTGETIRAIAAAIKRSPSTVSRELRRNATTAGQYHPFQAHRAAALRRRRPRQTKLATDPELLAWVKDALTQRWSPSQISRALRREFPDRLDWHLSAETIYLELYRPKSLLLRRPDPSPLRTRRDHRRAHMRLTRRRRRFSEPMLSVHQRPFPPEDRSQPGHWEGDVIVGPQHRSAIGTLVERQSRLVKLIHLSRPDSFELRDGLLRELVGLPAGLLRSITWDQGSEMARHLDITAATGVKVYFCDAGSPWQRGTNENTNGLLRQYFPKGTDLSRHSRTELALVERELNNRPRAVLHDRTPADVFTQLLTSATVLMLQ